jgi:NAD-dependent protein deacetylase/lipoamidase
VSAKRTRTGVENEKPSIWVQYLDMSAERLTELLRERQPCVVLTGAGISTESGIPDFRSAEGIWARYDPAEVAHIDAFRREPARVWEFYALRLDALARADPNEGHRALAELEEQGRIQAVITQNVDGLHRRAGSREVVEVHGSLREAECVHCGVRVPMADAVASLPLPPCPECGEVLKPGVVMFGELLPARAIERAQSLAAEAGLLLVVGSSLEVHPVAALPRQTLAAGGALAIVNRGRTPWDSRAELVIDAAAGETLRALASALGIVGADRSRRSDG